MSNLHEEVTEQQVVDEFAEFGPINPGSIHLNLDRKTGYAKGYAIIEYAEYEQAAKAKSAMNGKLMLDRVLSVDFAFLKRPLKFSR